MKPLLCFLGGCEFEYIIHELKSDPQKYFDFDYFHSFEHRAETNPYTFLVEHTQEVFETKPDMAILSQHDIITEESKNRTKFYIQQNQRGQVQNTLAKDDYE